MIGLHSLTNPSPQQIRLNYFENWQMGATCVFLYVVANERSQVCVFIKCSSVGEMCFTENSHPCYFCRSKKFPFFLWESIKIIFLDILNYYALKKIICTGELVIKTRGDCWGSVSLTFQGCSV